jgi:signal transduction histidine kinase
LLVDIAIAVVVAVVVCVAIRTAHEVGARQLDAFAYVIGVAMGTVLLARRRQPLAVLLATAILLLVYYSVGYPGVEPAVPLAVATYTAARAGYLRWCVGVALFYVLADLAVPGVRHHDPVLPLLNTVVQDAALLLVVILLGINVRSRQIRLAQAEVEREQEAASRVAKERLRIAREVHDIVGHSISAIAVQTALAADILDEDRDRAHAALDVVLAASRKAMTEIKVTVGMLRAEGGDDEPAVARGLDDLEALAELVRQPELRVHTTVLGTRRPLPAVLDHSAYRIVQESLTNVVRHARAANAEVTIRYAADGLSIDIVDDGIGLTGTPSGFGLAGMRERVAALGGRFNTSSPAGGGFHVSAFLPNEGEQ